MFSGGKRATRLEAETTRRNQQIIENFVKNEDVPCWYRGLSSFQIEAARKLHYAIRDDLEQGTTDRVLNLLNRIGLRPSISNGNIRFLMFMSGGNDLAFLWFIKELFYKSDGPDCNLNEQLILSSIAHLDILFTLRGLDSILPPEQPTKEEIRRIARKKIASQKLKFLNEIETEKHTINSMRIKYKLPYFDELVRPRLYEHQLTAYPPTYRTKLIYKDVLRDANFVIPNESNRWFADYQLHPGKKTGVQMLTDKMQEIFKTKLPKQSMLLNKVFNQHLFNTLNTSGYFHEDMQKKILCLHHQALEEMEKNLENELRWRAQEKCLRYFDPETPKREERIERIRRQIEADVKEHMIHFKELANRTRSHMKIISQDEIRVLDSKDFFATDRCCGGFQRGWTKLTCHSESCLTQRDNSCEDGYKPTTTKSHNLLASSSETGNNWGGEIIGDCLTVSTQAKAKCCKECKANPAKHKQKPTNATKYQRVRDILHKMPCDCGYKYVKNYDYGHSEQAKDVTESYFRAPDENRPYTFDYPKVYESKERESTRLNVQKAFLKVINSDLNLEKNDPNTPKNLDDAVKAYAKKAFKEGVTAKNIELAAEEEREKQRRRYPFLEVEMDYYDPDDRKLMQSMLKNALDYLAQNPKYVLASMPDAHKMPSLLAWMETRYGKTYTNAQLTKLHIRTRPTFRALKQMTADVLMPSAKKLGNAIFVNYNCRDYLMKKTELMRNEYYRRLNASIMDQSRTFYLAIKPHICKHPRDTFFAYMPSREADIQHFRIWRSHEHMPAKDEFFKRKCRAMKLANRFY
ncbi:uncharacterized protein LOC114804796 [Zeugodacus cucurbitae]|uniref:Mitogen-activated protein kinase kinase kinase 3 n=1 Tax=Zeugodacus cucurbitae TaxID=28588 RepID=A0A0A1X121_ZEUCU|nr:uncharacterized protein LOC114804796 [Zeugodacus cucurbitae]